MAGLIAVLAFLGLNVVGHVVIGRLEEGSVRAWWRATEPPRRYRS